MTHEERYALLKTESMRYGERNDCSVIATAMIFSLTYNEAHSLLFRLGRNARRGFNMSILERHYKTRLSKPSRPKQPNGSSYTVKTIANTIPVGKYLVYTRGHVLACINGDIYDWTEDRKHRVTHIVEIDSLFDML